ncbi:MAG: hypothetical protein NTX44_09780 [Ignavibacteriales bacterium]|nr:hypothetical protein [Ignavibacteriales bacterium]
MIKHLVILGILIFLFLASILSSAEVTAVFEAVWDGPFFTTMLGKLGGYLPDQFFFSESTWKNRRGQEEFFIALDDNGGKAWARIHSDTSKASAVWLPRKSVEILNNDVVRFVRTLRIMFKDSSRHAMRGMFIFGKRKLAAEAAEFKLSQDEELKFGHARAFNVLTFDTTGTPDIRGRVVTDYDGALYYRKVSIHLPDDEIEVTLEEQKEK